MPQVFFNTNTFEKDSFPPLSKEILCDLSIRSCAEHQEIGRKISPNYLLYKVPGFFDALSDDFKGWHLHHITGEEVSRKTLIKHGLYEKRPWWELRFMRVKDHRQIHGDPELFMNEYYGY